MISLVTTCMNRESHLRRSLPHWITLPGIDEIVLVDWSTREPFTDLLALDPRIRIVRAEGEPRWIQPYANNLGIAHARGDIIIKCDADCLPTADASKLMPANGHFYAGDWRSGEKLGKACVNGQCIFTKAQWEQVNGYSELLRRYSRDDVDFYDRLVAVGHARHEIPVDLLNFLDHSNEDRVANVKPAAGDNIDALLNRELPYHETINIVVATYMPWGPWFVRAPYTVVSSEDRLTVVRRDLTREIPISPALHQTARSHAIRAVAAQLCKIPAATLARMDEAACLAQLRKKLTHQVSNSFVPRGSPGAT